METRYRGCKTVISVVISVAIILTTLLSAVAFSTDTPSEWALDEVLKAREYGLIPAGMYHSFITEITRAEFCRLVMALYTKITGVAEKPYPTSVFTDTNNVSVLNAYGLGIVKGIGGGLFAPETLITRQEIAVMLYNAIKAINAETGKNILRNTSVILTFVDKDLTDDWASEAIGSLRNNDIMLGDDRNRFNPLDNTTKEMAFILVNRIYLIFAGLDAKKAFPTAYSGEILMRIKGNFAGGTEYQIIGDVYEQYPDVSMSVLARYIDGDAFVDGNDVAYHINRSESLSESVSAGYAGGQYYPVYVLISDDAPQRKLFIVGDGTLYSIYMDAGRLEPYFQKTFSDVLFAIPEDTPIMVGANARTDGSGGAGSAGGGANTGTGASGGDRTTGSGDGAAGSAGAGAGARSRAVIADDPDAEPADTDTEDGGAEQNAASGTGGADDTAGTPGTDDTAATSGATGADDTSGVTGDDDKSDTTGANGTGAMDKDSGVDDEGVAEGAEVKDGEGPEDIIDEDIPEAAARFTFSALRREAPELLDMYMWRVQLSKGKVTRLSALVF